MSKKQSQYGRLGVEADKGVVSKTFRAADNEVPGAFCRVVTCREMPEYYKLMHVDGVGSGSINRWIYAMVTGDTSVMRGDYMCALSMNTGDMACCGAVERFYAIDVVNINKLNVPKYVYLQEIDAAITEAKELYRQKGIELLAPGGETADLPQQTSSHVIDVFADALIKKAVFIRGNVKVGDKIWGISSGHRTPWEEKENSGHMSNGKTLSREVLLSNIYNKKFPKICPRHSPYKGRFKIDDHVDELGMSIGEALNSPTRQWAIIIKTLIEKLKRRGHLFLLHGISMNTGGGATKVGCLGKGIIYYKKMPRMLPLFRLIQEESGETLRNMYETFNCGVGLDIVGSDSGGILSAVVKETAEESKLPHFHLGVCESYSGEGNKVVLETPYCSQKFEYLKDH